MVEPQDEPDGGLPSPDAPPPSPSRRSRPLAAVVRAGARIGGAFNGLGERAQSWDERTRASSFVPDAQTIHIDERRHPFLLLAPALRTVAGLLALASGFRFGPLIVLVLLTAVWAQVRMNIGLKRTALVAGGSALALIAVTALAGPVLSAALLLGWLVEDLADWYTDRLVVTDKRIYRLHGVLTRHSPSIALTAIAYIDAAVPPVGRFLHYGTLRLDSVAQRDAPLSRFDLIPEVVEVSHEILRLRALAMPKFQQPH